MELALGTGIVLAFLWGARKLWRKAWEISSRTANPGGDYFILDRDAPPRKR